MNKLTNLVVDLEGAEPAPASIFGRRTDAVAVLMISENGTTTTTTTTKTIYKSAIGRIKHESER